MNNNWAFRKNTGRSEQWPKNEDGTAVEPALLERISGTPADLELTVSLLRAYNIPVMASYPNNGELGKLYFGTSGTGIEIFVPETMLEDAQNIISADIDFSELNQEAEASIEEKDE